MLDFHKTICYWKSVRKWVKERCWSRDAKLICLSPWVVETQALGSELAPFPGSPAGSWIRNRITKTTVGALQALLVAAYPTASHAGLYSTDSNIHQQMKEQGFCIILHRAKEVYGCVMLLQVVLEMLFLKRSQRKRNRFTNEHYIHINKCIRFNIKM